ncbi:hypothetical protein MS3_00005481 [Schistosoma haematobium]|uniref:C2H2-type domain-containing protein n=1 Tax=Schistosoma haematobium TaxID=6185 RepID=A0A922S0A4_SCHHA|nr:hypothetical protein MS3_00005481 [Schistosoma haematobium]KAH9587916.1 hypothetical protein MS3_00005481 [Schistosoma haematobium]
MTTTSPIGLTNNELTVKLVNSDYIVSEPITVDTSSMDVDSNGTTPWDTGSILNNDEITMKRNDLELVTSHQIDSTNLTPVSNSTNNNNNNNSNNISNTTCKMNTLSYIPPGLISVMNESKCLTVCAIGHFSVGHTWGPYLIHIGSELRQKLIAFSTEVDPDFLVTLTVKSKDSSHENANSLIVGEEHTWIRVIHETGLHSDKNEHNLDILVDPILKTITLQTRSDINPQDFLIGVVRIVSDSQKAEQITMSSGHNSTLYNNTKSSTSTSVLTSSSNNLPSTGPRRDKKCTHCGISFSNLDTLNAHMAHYCSRRPGLVSSTSAGVQPSVSVSVTHSDTSTNKSTNNKFNNQRQNSSQSFGTNALGSNFSVNSSTSVSAVKYSTMAENNSESNPVNMRDENLLDPIQMGNLINPTFLNLFGVGDTTYLSQMLQNPLAYFMLPMISRLIPPISLDTQGNESNLNIPLCNQSVNHILSPTAMKQPPSTSDKMKSNHSSEFTTKMDSSDTHISPTQLNTSGIQNNNAHNLEHQAPRVLFCPNCQQLYASQYLSTFPPNSNKLEPFMINPSETSLNQNIESVGNMLSSNDMVWTLSQLSAVAHRFGLILAAPLVTANGLQYIPVNLNSKLPERHNSEKYQNNQSVNGFKNTNNTTTNNSNFQTLNNKRQCTTPISSCEFINDSLNSSNNSNNSSVTLSPSSYLTNPTNFFGNKQPEASLPRLNTSNILDLSANPSNPQLLNSFKLYNTINEFRDSQQQQNYCQSQLFSQKKKEHFDIMKDSSSCSNGTLNQPNNSLLKVPCHTEDTRNDFGSLLDNQTPIENNNNNNNNMDKNLLHTFSQMLSQANGLSTNSQTIPFPFNVNQLLFMLYASLATNSMNIQSSFNLSALMTEPVSSNVTNVIPPDTISHSVNPPTSNNAPNSVVKTITDNCDNGTNNPTFTNSNHSNMYKKFSSLPSIPFSPMCIHPLISSSSDQLINTSSNNTLQNTFPIPATSITTVPTGVINNIPINSSQNFTCTSSSVSKLEPNSTGVNNTSVNDSSNNNNSSVLNLLPALKLLGSIFPQFSTIEQNHQQQRQQHEPQIQQINLDSCSSSKQSKLSTRGINSEQLISPATSPQPTVLRPYLCKFCRTRFQAFSTFQAHQQFYCQGRKEVMKQLHTSTTNSVTSHIPTSSGNHTVLNCTTTTGSPASKRRCTTTDSLSSTGHSLNHTGNSSTNQTNSSTSSSGDEAESVKSNRLSPSGSKLSPNRNLQNSQEVNTDCETDQSNSTHWEPCGASELRCSACGYVGQTPRGMKMHRKLHECNGTTSKNPKSTCEIKTENDILTKNFDINLHVTNDHNSPMINNIKKLHKVTNDNNNNNHNSNAFLDDFVKKEQL